MAVCFPTAGSDLFHAKTFQPSGECLPGDKAARACMHLTTQVCLVLSLRINGTTTPFCRMLSLRIRRYFNLYTSEI